MGQLSDLDMWRLLLCARLTSHYVDFARMGLI